MLCGLEAQMPIDHFSGATRNNRNTKSKLDDGCRHLRDDVIIAPGIACVGL
jgi:hypothetical protein